jgi:hypothetical protein
LGISCWNAVADGKRGIQKGYESWPPFAQVFNPLLFDELMNTQYTFNFVNLHPSTAKTQT